MFTPFALLLGQHDRLVANVRRTAGKIKMCKCTANHNAITLLYLLTFNFTDHKERKLVAA